MRADRLLSILLLLQNRGKLTTRQLSGMLEISERTVHRDMEALSAAGIPVLAERGREGGWMLAEGYRTRLTGMKPREIGALLLTADPAILDDLGIKEDFAAAARKLEAVSRTLSPEAGYSLAGQIHIDGVSWHPIDESVPYLVLLQHAMQEKRRVRISYGQSTETKERIIEPLGLVAKKGVWYAVACCEGELRTYRVSRITQAEITEEHFQRPPGFDLQAYWEQSTRDFKASLPRYPAELRIRDSALPELEKERYVKVLSSAISPDPVWLAIKAEFQTFESAKRIILSYGADVIVTTPPELRQEVENTACAIVSLYQTPESGPRLS
ncbi:Predicted DNA-binding transcriptional regulator YafY, contains an HTH and WYL domains [Paenibacillus sophorae]|uniref:Predicted DNA-binding transcriptional regulator YafY, contains an HTH and WYL domains n=1 Tax=Paenibacillus sophorae TaxID=1333845 RepID=A0A1H8NDM9_9BACL|nr:YafY family protein [Paenibacillus sophorae]QWU14668.1 YafY family transcriptional regulator [Paenibacillus sophorae]SEO27710.1 Predicted DNA-binding transcriptional regulator YafY, contains an HTH and WYL domains [Paenibacillus sophorae]